VQSCGAEQGWAELGNGVMQHGWQVVGRWSEGLPMGCAPTAAPHSSPPLLSCSAGAVAVWTADTFKLAECLPPLPRSVPCRPATAGQLTLALEASLDASSHPLLVAHPADKFVQGRPLVWSLYRALLQSLALLAAHFPRLLPV